MTALNTETPEWVRVEQVACGELNAWNVSKKDICICLVHVARAILTLTAWLVQAQTGFNAHDMEGVNKVLRGEVDPKTDDK